MDPYGVAIRLAGHLSPTLQGRLWWRRQRKRDLTLRVVDACVARGDTVVDIGANVGLFSARMLRLVGRSGRVHAFEPHPGALAHLRRHPARLMIHPVALSDREGDATLHVPIIDGSRRMGLSALSPPRTRGLATDEVEVSVSRLDALLPDGEVVSFIKCDVEGHELAVLRGAQETLRRSKALLLIEIEQRHHDDSIERVFDFLRQLGYRGHAITEDALFPIERFDAALHQVVGGGPFVEVPEASGYVSNFLFVPIDRDLPDALDQCRTS